MQKCLRFRVYVCVSVCACVKKNSSNNFKRKFLLRGGDRTIHFFFCLLYTSPSYAVDLLANGESRAAAEIIISILFLATVVSFVFQFNLQFFTVGVSFGCHTQQKLKPSVNSLLLSNEQIVVDFFSTVILILLCGRRCCGGRRRCNCCPVIIVYNLAHIGGRFQIKTTTSLLIIKRTRRKMQ